VFSRFVHCLTVYTMLPPFWRVWQASDMTDRLTPGVFVRHPDLPDWGIGQVQSVIGDRVTVNFENAGKQLINRAAVPLIEVDLESNGNWPGHE
jgi:hypothetical protein